ncbi:MAG: peptide chain release factor N(5)-glutamine methyltransferase, partial [Lachnospiraceae bacterium]|nr:peptide chain release factor N(5)-glutamine methyltransferase [Lachnospiraceae bacterium]
MEYKKLYDRGVSLLSEVKIEEAALDARLLLEEICGTDRNDLLVHGDRLVTEEQYNCYENYIDMRRRHIPLQHILGYQEFMGLKFKVTPDVLIPRQDTETLVEEVMRNLHDGMHILDMCTGSGCILLSLLRYSNDCVGVGCD